VETRSRGAAPRWLGLAPAVFLLLWSSGFAFVKMGLAHAEPMTFLALRYAAVLAVLVPLALVLGPPWPRPAAAWRHLAVIGVLVQALYFGLCNVAIGLGMSAGGLALVVSLQPILVAVLAPRLAGERVGASRWAGLALGLAGATLVIGTRSAIGSTSVLGVLSAVGALAGMTAGTLYEKRFGVAHHPVTANLVQYAVGFAVVLPTALVLEDMHVAWTGELVVSLAYLVVANSLVSITLLLAMIRHGEVSRVSALLFLVPPTAALVAWALLGEAMPTPAWIGMALAAGGVALASRPGPGRA
jgi:drug/metabolite transporter (DMT)-like permease